MTENNTDDVGTSYTMRGFGSVASASRFCRAFDEVRQFFSGPDHHETKGFPAATTRDVSSTIGSAFGHVAGGLTSRRIGAEVPNTFCYFLQSQF
jgi:hypothetical protein